MGGSGGLAIDTLAEAVLRGFVGAADATGGLLAGRRGAIIARTAPPGSGLPLRLPQALMRECLGGDTVVVARADRSVYATDPALAGRAVSILAAPVTWSGRVIAVIYAERPETQPFSFDDAAALLERACHLGINWPDAEPDIESFDELPPLFVLLVEDNEINRKVAQAFLERAGHSVSVAVNGIEAVAAVAAGDFDLVLMDIRMPGMDGVEATKRIRAMDDFRKARLPILALTANFSADEVAEYLAAGMNLVLRKPLRLGAIEDALKPLFLALPSPPPRPIIARTRHDDQPVIDQERLKVLAEALDPDKLAELCGAARVSISESWTELRRAWDCADASGAGKSAHRLAGVAANFGCAALAQLAGMVENDARSGGDGKSRAVALEALVKASMEGLPG